MSEAVPCLHCKTFPLCTEPCPRCAAPARLRAGHCLPPLCAACLQQGEEERGHGAKLGHTWALCLHGRPPPGSAHG